MDSVNWLNLERSIWIDIFDLLDVKSLKSVTETCRTFANLFDSSTKLNRKVKLVITPESIEALKQSKRKYRNALLQDMRDAMEEADLRMIQSTFSELEEVELRNTYSGNLLMFEAATNLRQILIGSCKHEDNSFRNLLSNQRNLKHLDIRGAVLSCCRHVIMPPLLSSSQLEYLRIASAHWDNEKDKLTFFDSQQSLRSIELWIDEPWYSDTFELILRNKKLRTVNIQGSPVRSIMTDAEADAHIQSWPKDVVCPSVVNLKIHYRKGDEDDLPFIEYIIKAFPNVRKYYGDDFATKTDLLCISSWRLLESLDLKTKHGNLKELEVKSEGFKVFNYNCGYSPKNTNLNRLFKDLGKFLRRHRTIRHLTLILYNYNRYNRFPDKFDALIAGNIPELETLRVVPLVHESFDDNESPFFAPIRLMARKD